MHLNLGVAFTAQSRSMLIVLIVPFVCMTPTGSEVVKDVEGKGRAALANGCRPRPSKKPRAKSRPHFPTLAGRPRQHQPIRPSLCSPSPGSYAILLGVAAASPFAFCAPEDLELRPCPCPFFLLPHPRPPPPSVLPFSTITFFPVHFSHGLPSLSSARRNQLSVTAVRLRILRYILKFLSCYCDVCFRASSC